MIFKKYFANTHARSKKAIKNIASAFVIKGASIAINLALVPLTISYLNPTKYGIWLTISSILGWVDFFDIGLGHGLRNKLAESVAEGNMKKAKAYVSTAYISVSILCAFLFGIFLIINEFIDWNAVLNVPENMDEDIKTISFIVFFMFSMRFILQLINSIFLGYQESAKVSFNVALGNLLVLIGIFLVTHFSHSSLLYVAFLISVVPVLVLLGVNIFYFSTKLKTISPSFKSFDYNSLKNILHLGVKFFIIQISLLILFQTSNLLISRYFSPDLVTSYNIAFKYFGVITMVFNIIISPYWSAYTEAYVKQDYAWMRRSLTQLLRIWGGLSVVAVIMLFASNFMYHLWIGDKVKIDFSISLFMMFYVVLTCFGDVYIRFLNGVGNVRPQMIVNLIGMVLYIPMSYLLAVRWGMGVSGIILSIIICNSYGILIAPFQVRKILNKHLPV